MHNLCYYCACIMCTTVCIVFQGEWHFFITGVTIVPKKLPNPASDWLSDRAWGEVLILAALVRNIMKAFIQHSYMYATVCVCMYLWWNLVGLFPSNIRSKAG